MLGRLTEDKSGIYNLAYEPIWWVFIFKFNHKIPASTHKVTETYNYFREIITTMKKCLHKAAEYVKLEVLVEF